jgi:NAD(P)H-quinone oxidoreductase subunit 5
MEPILATALIAPPLSLIAAGLLPPRVAAALGRRFQACVTAATGMQFLLAATAACWLAAQPPGTQALALPTWPIAGPLAISLLYDGVSSLMLGLVSFIGWVICRYSIRYLDGEPGQSRYFRWTAFTIGSVSLLVVSGNLLLLVVCWVMTSLGLHQLLLHYGDRPAAQRAAWTKFTISRIGDAALIAAIANLYAEFATLEFSDLFAAVEAAGEAAPRVKTAAWLLVLGAITKSAQFPFHTWLPLTMETPTPVSALMHAGIVNAGGYLLIRTSPIVVLAPLALDVLAIVGAVTACLAAVVMLTQTSIKKSLAYSTIAQMGFMMLQCGLGAYSAALLHILAHSLYKAHAFLSSGSVLAQRSGRASETSGAEPRWGHLALTAAILAGSLAASLASFGVDVRDKPGGWLLGSVLCLALLHWMCQVLRSGDRRLLIPALAIAVLLCFASVATFVAVDTISGASLPRVGPTPAMWLVTALVWIGFAGMFALQVQLTGGNPRRWMNAWYVHALNGFYIESTLRRVFGPLRSS